MVQIPDIKLIVLDVDHTLAKPNGPFFQQFPGLIDSALARALNCTLLQANSIASHYRRINGRGHDSFHDSNLGKVIAQTAPSVIVPTQLPLGSTWEYDAFLDADPTPYYAYDKELIDLVHSWRTRGIILSIVTDSPECLSRKVLGCIGFAPDHDFDDYIPWRREELGPPKRIMKEGVFTMLLNKYGVAPANALSIGDSKNHDIRPAHALGMKACIVGKEIDLEVYKVKTVKEVVLI